MRIDFFAITRPLHDKFGWIIQNMSSVGQPCRKLQANLTMLHQLLMCQQYLCNVVFISCYINLRLVRKMKSWGEQDKWLAWCGGEYIGLLKIISGCQLVLLFPTFPTYWLRCFFPYFFLLKTSSYFLIFKKMKFVCQFIEKNYNNQFLFILFNWPSTCCTCM